MNSLKNALSPCFAPLLRVASALAILVILASGCARKPWGDSFEEEALDTAKAEIAGYIARHTPCGKTLSADLALLYEDPLGKKALKGYFEFSQPKAFKFVMTNPFGQPIFAVAGTNKTFEAILARDSQFIAGSLNSYALRHNLPVEFIKGDWGSWLMGQSQTSVEDIVEIREDQTGRGLWVIFRPSKPPFAESALLFERESGNVLERLIQNAKGKTIARITYSDWSAAGTPACGQPAQIAITDLGYGTTITLRLSHIEVLPEAVEYDLKPPRGYFQQYLP